MVRRLAPEEKALWGKVMATVKPIHVLKPAAEIAAKPKSPAIKEGRSPAPAVPETAAGQQRTAASGLRIDPPAPAKEIAPGHLDGTWDRRIHKGAVVPDVSVDLHGQGLATAHARLDRTLEQAIHQKLRVVLLVTGHARAHDRASGQGRGAIAAVVRDWLAASRHAAAISAVRPAHPRHGGAGALYIVLKR
jgi:DNA-nicking Smr family endonuclease